MFLFARHTTRATLQITKLQAKQIRYFQSPVAEYLNTKSLLIKQNSFVTSTVYNQVKMAIPNVVFVLGGPGSGKGTQCANIIKDFPFEHLSAGDLLREERASGSENGDLIESYIKEGKIVPVEITIKLLENAMNKSSKNDFLIDGFPRNKDNLQGWFKCMDGKANIKFVLFFDCPEDTCIDRAMARGAAGSGRTDDNMDSLRLRFKTYYDSTMPIINHFEEKGLVKKIDATKGPEEVYKIVEPLFK